MKKRRKNINTKAVTGIIVLIIAVLSVLGSRFFGDFKDIYDEAKQNYLDAIALHTKVKGSPMAKTVQYLMETNNQITDAELDL